MKILDIDLDFFLNNRALHIANDSAENRLPDCEAKPWEESEVRNFLEKQCFLSKDQKPIGITVQSHDEVFSNLRHLISLGVLSTPFDFVHVDAHSDLGLGDASWSYIMQDIINRPVNNRYFPKSNGLSGINFGNWLAFAISCRWIKILQFVLHEKWHDDIQRTFLWDKSDKSINMLKYDISNKRQEFVLHMIPLTQSQIDDICLFNKPPAYDQIYSDEPIIDFELIPYKEFSYSETFDFIFLTHSPSYTPKSADSLIPVIESYFSVFKTEQIY